MPALDLSRRLMAAGCPFEMAEPSITVEVRADRRDRVRDANGILWMWCPSSHDSDVGEWLPDLTDPLTVCASLLALRERLGDPLLHVVPRAPKSNWTTWGRSKAWVVWVWKGHFQEYAAGHTESEAVVLAWEGVTRER